MWNWNYISERNYNLNFRLKNFRATFLRRVPARESIIPSCTTKIALKTVSEITNSAPYQKLFARKSHSIAVAFLRHLRLWKKREKKNEKKLKR